MEATMTIDHEYRGRVMYASFILMALLFVGGCSRSPSVPSRPVTLVSELQALEDPAGFPRTPLGRAGLASTYDRTGGNNDWATWTPGDAAPDGSRLVADLKGPGCVKRIWITGFFPTQWLFYFDGEKTPRLSLSSNDLFGGKAPFLPPIAEKVSGGYTSLLPLPYRKSLRIRCVVQKWFRAYYQVNYESYPPGTQVESFPVEISAEQQRAIDSLSAAWQQAGQDARDAVDVEPQTIPVDPGATREWVAADGPSTLVHVWFTLTPPEGTTARARAALLRELILSVRWDGKKAPSVHVPLGHFFCNARYPRRYSSMAMAKIDDTYVCRLPMPFRKGVIGEIRNTGPTPVILETGVCFGDAPAADAPYLHARWFGGRNLGRPLELLNASGRGHYVGCFVSLSGTDGSWKILEGDEQFWVDGEAEPSLRGTGLEDYFGGAWYYSGIFDRPLFGLVEKAAMATDQYRFHLNDAVRFDRSLRMTFEFGEANRSQGFMSGVAYWYQSRPVPAGSTIPALGRIPSHRSPIDPVSMMARLFELEREGLWEEARDRCVACAGSWPGHAYSPGLRLRAAAYDLKIADTDASRRAVRAFAEGDNRDLAAQAKAVLWAAESRHRALLCGHASGKFICYLDGKRVLAGEGSPSVACAGVELTPGEHEIAVEASPARGEAWVSLALHSGVTNLSTDATWEASASRPPAWPGTEGNGVNWAPAKMMPAGAILPRQAAWQFVPNAFVGMQCEGQLAAPWRGWSGARKQDRAYLRKRFVVPE